MITRSGLAAADALQQAVAAVGLDEEPGLAVLDSGADLVVVTPSGDKILVQVKQQSLISAVGLGERLDQWTAQRPDDSAIRVVVADRVTREAREVLRRAGWGWLDLRGHLHLTGPGLFVDADVPAMRETSAGSNPLAGRVGIEVAAALLLRPDEPGRVRPIAAELGRAPSSVSHTLTAMRDAALIDGQRRPAVPELFWELASRWQPVQVDLNTIPTLGDGPVNDVLRLGVDDVAGTSGWALTDTVAAAAYGAPVAARSAHPPDFYVPDQATSRRAVQLLAAAGNDDRRAGTVRIAPVPIICARRVDAAEWSEQGWPLALPLFVALDLAQDPGRGREVLDQWTPQRAGRRVW